MAPQKYCYRKIVKKIKQTYVMTERSNKTVFFGGWGVALCLALTACNYRESKISSVDPLIEPETASTPPPSVTPVPEVQKEWFTALQKTVFNPKCVECHRPGNAKKDVILTSYKAILEADPPIIRLFKPKSSVLFRCIVHEDPEKRMPPNSAPLSEAECQAIYNWILKGAPEKNPDAGLADEETSETWDELVSE